MNQKLKSALFSIGKLLFFLAIVTFAPQSAYADIFFSGNTEEPFRMNQTGIPDGLRGFFNGISASSQMAAGAAAANKKTANEPKTTDNSVATKFSDEDLIAITKPSIVRIVVHITGTSTIPSYDVDWTNLTFKKTTRKPTEVPFNTYLYGSGFIVHPDGYIATNAHVASDEAMKLVIAVQKSQEVALKSLFSLSKTKAMELEKQGFGEKEGQKLALNGFGVLRTDMVSKTEIQIAIIKTEAEGGTAKKEDSTLMQRAAGRTTEKIREVAAQFLKDGIPAKVISLNTKFVDDERDIALLKVEQKNLPALRLDTETTPIMGNAIFIFGYPAAADIAILDNEASFTKGTINALKSSGDKTFKLIQTDAKISTGSSGGPVFNGNGDVIGIITAQTNQNGRGGGDNFAFAIPSALLKDTFEKEHISKNLPTGYRDNFLAGLNFEKESRCKLALEKFEAAKQTNTVFGEVSSFITPHIEDCKKIIASGKSVDIEEERVAEEALKKQKADDALWFKIKIGAGAILLVGIIIGIIVFFRKRRRGEETAGSPEVGTEYANGNAVSPLGPQIVSSIDPQLLQYIAQARSVGQTDAQIREALLPNGWRDTDIDTAFQNLLLGGETPK